MKEIRRTVISTTTGPTVVESTTPTEDRLIYILYQTIWYIVGIIELMLGLRFVLHALGVNSYNSFSSFIYSFSEPFALPFFGIVPNSANGLSVLEWTTLIGMVVYLIATSLVVEFINIFRPTYTNEIEEER